jgi:hypothetical protein
LPFCGLVGRLQTLKVLDGLLFEHAPTVLERAHLHNVIEQEPWLFGEEFSTHVSDQSLTALLRAHVALLGREGLDADPVTDHAGRSRRIDFMFGRALEQNRNRREHLVVEIKRPSIVIGRDQINQIEDYARAVARDPRFDTNTVEWDFLLIGTKLDDHAEDKASQRDKPRGLVDEPAGRRYRIWVKTWAEILQECQHRLKFIREQLRYDPDTDEALSYFRRAYPDYLPAHLRAPQTDTSQDAGEDVA